MFEFHIFPYYSVLFRIILYYSVLSHIIPHYSVLFRIIPYYSVLFRIITYYSKLFRIILYHFVLFCIIPYYSYNFSYFQVFFRFCFYYPPVQNLAAMYMNSYIWTPGWLRGRSTHVAIPNYKNCGRCHVANQVKPIKARIGPPCGCTF